MTNTAVTPDKSFTDPVCGMKVAANPEKMVKHAGLDYYFCSMHCKNKFHADPHFYLHPKAPEPPLNVAEGTIYTCRMHPEVRQPVPGNCPKWGMTLEPVDTRLAGLIAVSDPIKATTPEALATLKKAGLKIVLATGDGVTTARSVAAKLGIDEVLGEVKPQDKLALAERLQAQGKTVAMAGDGINDEPALAKADVGIAMGTGTDVAIHSAHVKLVKGDLRAIARARSISVGTVRNMRQNLAFAFVYNALGISLAAGLLYPFTWQLLSPMIAALAMSLSSVSVMSNALRLHGTAQ